MASQTPKPPQEFIDTLGAFDAGINNDISPLLLPANQLASALNTTVRGTFVTQRPNYRNIKFDQPSQALINSAFNNGGFYQGGSYYKPDLGSEQIGVEIGGIFLLITPGANTPQATVVKPPDPNGAGPNPRTQPQAWLWQSENFLIVNDGVSAPFWYDGFNIFRSTWNQKTNNNTYATATAIVPAVGSTVSLTVNSIAGMVAGQGVQITGIGNFTIQSASGSAVVLVNVNANPGTTIPTGSAPSPNVFFASVSTQLPPGRQGAYVMGRNCFFLVDGKQFVIGDLVGGSSGTQANNYRDAVLNITENLYLAGGGNFTVPGSLGSGQTMTFSQALDQALGQGSLMVFTDTAVFSAQLPTDRLTWQSVTNPLLPAVLLNDGATGQYSTVSVNSDLVFRSPFGIRSLILARRDFDVWGNTPQSREVEPLISTDNPGLLQYESAIVFDNRHLLTVQPQQTPQGVIFTSVIPLNLDPLSSLQGKSPSVYDSLQWTGLNIFQLFTGKFNKVQRAFALTWNNNTSNCELWEILPSANTAYLDDGIARVVWDFNSASLFREKDKVFKRLIDGELQIDNLEGTASIQVWFKPDQWPCWVPWIAFEICQTQPANGINPGFRPRLGLGEPSGQFCDPDNNRPLRCFYTCQIRVVVTGKLRFLSGKFKCVEESEPLFAQPICSPICPTST